jgi:hypothetical protein
MVNRFKPTEDDMRKTRIVLGDALPYELLMLEIAARYMQEPQFKQLKKEEKSFDWLTHNATVESFWTHARCLIEFFNRTKNNNFDASSASARDFTAGYEPSDDIAKLSGPGKLSEKINEQVSHVGFCRKTELYEKLGSEMKHVKATIDKETKAFDAKLRKEFREHFKWTPVDKSFILDSGTATCRPTFHVVKII